MSVGNVTKKGGEPMGKLMTNTVRNVNLGYTIVWLLVFTSLSYINKK